MKSIKLSIVAALLATTSLVSNVSAEELEVSANVALTSNYVWRGMTQTMNSPAVQGGVDLAYKGAYAGVWGSSVDFGGIASSEFDIYAGYAGEVDKFSYDAGLIQYMYPGETKAANFAEAYLTLGYDFDVVAVSAMYALGIQTDDLDPGDAIKFGVSIPLPMDISLDGTYGMYDNKDTTNKGSTKVTKNEFGDYYLVSLSKSFGKFDWTLAYTGMDYDINTKGHESDGDEDNVVLTVATSF